MITSGGSGGTAVSGFHAPLMEEGGKRMRGGGVITISAQHVADGMCRKPPISQVNARASFVSRRCDCRPIAVVDAINSGG